MGGLLNRFFLKWLGFLHQKCKCNPIADNKGSDLPSFFFKSRNTNKKDFAEGIIDQKILPKNLTLFQTCIESPLTPLWTLTLSECYQVDAKTNWQNLWNKRLSTDPRLFKPCQMNIRSRKMHLGHKKVWMWYLKPLNNRSDY